MPDRRRDRKHVPKGHHSERDGFAFPKTVVAGEGWNTMKTECSKERSAPDVSSSASATACRSFGAMLTAFRYASMPDAQVNIMDQYRPDNFCDPTSAKYQERYAAIACRPGTGEVRAAYDHARRRGLNFEVITHEKNRMGLFA